MRPALLDPLFAPVTALPGVGPRLGALFNRLLGTAERPARVIDLLFHLPHSVIDRSRRPPIRDTREGDIVTLTVRVAEHRPPPPGRARAPFRVLVEDGTGDVTLVFFSMTQARIDKMLPLGETRVVSGRIEFWEGFRQMVHPDRIMREEEARDQPLVEPVYGQTEGLASRTIARIAQAALGRLPHLPEWQDAAWLAQQHSPDVAAALAALHRPESATAFAPESAARKRLAYDELLASQLALALMRATRRRASGRVNVGDGRLVAAVTQALPFSLTEGQRQAVADIRRDLAEPQRMLRLLQGDVGSGKTVVALLAMASAVEAGRQAALMAPTDILARQHFARLEPLARAAGITMALLTGREKGAARAATLAALESGAAQIAVGTHALFQDAVAFHDLALAVIDEQHRFGVHQRFGLSRKGEGVDMLVMTATPIPRTLTLTCFGDMDVSVLREKPAGRKPIDTRAMPLERLHDVVDGLHRALARGARVYWVCPLVEESETIDVAAAQERFEDLQRIFGPVVGLLHGKMSGRDKDAAMGAFQRGETRILVATTVIEVGVDVPEATIMVIEHAERFGLAQLHQLRGRIGRGADASTCLLLYKAPPGEVAKARINIMRETEDGFRIAEEDLRLRGEGEILGTRQSGAPAFHLARIEDDADLLRIARDDARLILERDPGLAGERGQALRILLYLFERDEAIRLLRAG
ncbi:MAG: ATP-dependent DNA helicase RecG [Pseudochelatococcus sp.]|jgi:ATP-dependent DNA helicase RecG|uniref:ATP-dependent DNA helicase RecG n=1 Tax=Pseudochelatococcus sp. TaxID=2020869 RepID=UPI003D8F0668